MSTHPNLIKEFIQCDNAECKHQWKSRFTMRYDANSSHEVPSSHDYVCKKCGQSRSQEFYSMRSDGVLVFSEAIKMESQHL